MCEADQIEGRGVDGVLPAVLVSGIGGRGDVVYEAGRVGSSQKSTIRLHVIAGRGHEVLM